MSNLRYSIPSKLLVLASMGISLMIWNHYYYAASNNNSNSSKNLISTITHVFQQHEPSARIFRSIMEINLVLFCTAISISLWSQTIGIQWIQRLLLFSNINNNNHQHQHNNISSFLHTHKDHLFHDNDNILKNDSDVSDDDEDEEEEDDDDEKNSFEKQPLSHISLQQLLFHTFLNNSLWIMLTLILFLWSALGWKHSTHESSNHTTTTSSSSSYLFSLEWIAWMTAPIFPLLLFLYGFLSITCRPKLYRSYWNVLSYTLLAPLFPITFRDGFVGDIITSMVRPLQDITFTLVYLLYGLRGWWSQSYSDYFYNHYYNNNNNNNNNGNDNQEEEIVWNSQQSSSSSSSSFQDHFDSSIVLPTLEKSWWLHTIILPFCVIGPLWWRFLQNLRQVHDEKQRWPYLGNAFKYFLAAQVAVTGIYYPQWHGHIVWLFTFVIATLYQIYWDIAMDWNLLVWSDNRWKLRTQRLYSSRWLYWFIVWINVVLRFGWTLTFIPPRYLNPAGALIQQNKFIMSPLLASAEIIRRTLWGWLRFEYEVLKVQKQEGRPIIQEHTMDDENDPEPEETLEHNSLELVPMTKMDTNDNTIPSIMRMNIVETSRVHPWNDMSSMNDTQILLELCFYAVTFATLWLIAIAHRSTQ